MTRSPSGDDPFAGFPLEQRVDEALAALGLEVDRAASTHLALHAREVLRHNAEAGLTAIVEPDAFVSRHVAESLAGAAGIAPDAQGVLLDLGSGNGYPGLPVALVRPGLVPVLVEAREKKAAFLGALLARVSPEGRVLARQVQRAADLAGLAPARAITVRALGGWERILPRLVPALGAEGEILLWAGADVDTVRRRSSWRRLRLVERTALVGRERSWIWRFARSG